MSYVQCIKCLSNFVYDLNKIGASTKKAHADTCLDSDNPSSDKTQDIIILMNKETPAGLYSVRMHAIHFC